eukprot:TRINITY_DN1203_c0_g1_i1.p2 TRINITY_DN1203_c0_g1~~TRINITY_DN1203_c0_g1_i1.p2  ORF type:complete len:103 (-),score=17.82 TRINITY_DN1203_c0_g1_i1:208-516(-)
MTAPCGEMRNLPKFHLMGSSPCIHTQRGCAFVEQQQHDRPGMGRHVNFSFTLTFSIICPLKPFFSAKALISAWVPDSCFANWLQGKATITRPRSPNFSCRAR